jgi:hypothetical protein
MCHCPWVVDSQFSTNKLGQRHKMELLCLMFTRFRKTNHRMAGFAGCGEGEGEADDGGDWEGKLRRSMNMTHPNNHIRYASKYLCNTLC